MIGQSKKPRRAVPADLADNARAMYVSGLAKHYGTGHVTVRNWLVFTGIEALETAPNTPVEIEDLEGFAEAAQTMCKIDLARHFNIHRHVVSRLCRLHGITPLKFIPLPPPPRARRAPEPKIRKSSASLGRIGRLPFVPVQTDYSLAERARTYLSTVMRCAITRIDDAGRWNPKGKFWRVGAGVEPHSDERLIERARAKGWAV